MFFVFTSYTFILPLCFTDPLYRVTAMGWLKRYDEIFFMDYQDIIRDSEAWPELQKGIWNPETLVKAPSADRMGFVLAYEAPLQLQRIFQRTLGTLDGVVYAYTPDNHIAVMKFKD